MRREPDATIGFRTATATFGLVLIGIGSLMTLLLFWRLYQLFLDPRPLEVQVDRWEFVIRGRATDGPIPVEREIASEGRIEADPLPAGGTGVRRPRDEVEAVAEIAGRIGSKAARPAAILIMLVLLGILVRIVLGVIDIGGRLVYSAAGERDILKRLVHELQKRRE